MEFWQLIVIATPLWVIAFNLNAIYKYLTNK
jgi:hypothetical protein